MKFRPTIGRVMRVHGHSMVPALAPGALVLVSEKAFVSREPRRGEIVAAAPRTLGGKTFVKRVLGLPSEHVTIGEQSWQLQANQFFLMGDQAEHSMDSRVFGPVRREELVGLVRFRLWPFSVSPTAPGTFPLFPSSAQLGQWKRPLGL